MARHRGDPPRSDKQCKHCGSVFTGHTNASYCSTACHILARIEIDPDKACVNPEHLFVGTGSDNMKDAQQKGRMTTSFKGAAAHRGAKLTEDQVQAIRCDPRPQGEVAEAYGLNQSSVSRIRTGARWAQLQGV